MHKLILRLQIWQPFQIGMSQMLWSCDGLQNWAVQGVPDAGRIHFIPLMNNMKMMSR